MRGVNLNSTCEQMLPLRLFSRTFAQPLTLHVHTRGQRIAVKQALTMAKRQLALTAFYVFHHSQRTNYLWKKEIALHPATRGQ